jgi:Ca2+-binding RTX toxin-like protein
MSFFKRYFKEYKLTISKLPRKNQCYINASETIINNRNKVKKYKKQILTKVKRIKNTINTYYITNEEKYNEINIDKEFKMSFWWSTNIQFSNNARNTLTGSSGRDILFGRGGDDILLGGDGNDSLFGGSGDDFLDGGAGNDFLSGGSGDDKLNGGTGSDFIVSGRGHDTIQAGADSDMVFAGRM